VVAVGEVGAFDVFVEVATGEVRNGKVCDIFALDDADALETVAMTSDFQNALHKKKRE
jgi:hypothetical protein